MDKRIFKNEVYAGIAAIAKAFSTANRLEIIDLLANGEKTVAQIAAQTDISVANTSRHLHILKEARLVKSRREGNFIYYCLNGRHAYAVWQALRTLAQEAAPAVQNLLREFREEMGSSGSMVYGELENRGAICLLDVRPREEFDAGHLPGAHSLPLRELEERLAELPRDKTIIAYCRGPFCTYADEAVRVLRSKGYEAVRLEENTLDIELTDRRSR
jgi:rhodanese-related sulfurtransferase/DNA-binding MarR family transcriptional regulator